MATVPKPRCSETVVEYQGLARFTHQCTKPAFEDGMCKTHLRAKRGPINTNLVHVPSAQPDVSTSVSITLQWGDSRQAPVFKPRHGETVAWAVMTFTFGTYEGDLRWSGWGDKIKDNGQPGKVRLQSSSNTWDDIPAEIKPFIAAAIADAKIMVRENLS